MSHLCEDLERFDVWQAARRTTPTKTKRSLMTRFDRSPDILEKSPDSLKSPTAGREPWGDYNSPTAYEDRHVKFSDEDGRGPTIKAGARASAPAGNKNRGSPTRLPYTRPPVIVVADVPAREGRTQCTHLPTPCP